MIDEVGFKSEQSMAREKSRVAWNGSGEKDMTFYVMLHKKVGDTMFVGYSNYTSEGKVLVITKNGKEVAEVKAGRVAKLCFQVPLFTHIQVDKWPIKEEYRAHILKV